MKNKFTWLVIFLLCLLRLESSATISITAATASICKNYAATGPAARWTTLGTITVKEGANRDFGNVTGSWSVTVNVAPPTGWQFNSSVSPSIGFTAVRNITSVTLTSISASSLTLVVSGTGRGARDQFTLTGLQVQATSTTSASGNVRAYSVSGTATGLTTTKNWAVLTHTSTTTGTASVSIAASPTGTICSGTSVTFTASPTNGGTPKYQWKLNGSNISGATNSTYTTTALANGNTISVTMISSSCITSPTANSSTYTATVNATPDITNFSSPTATSPCLGSSSTVTVNSTSLGSGTFTATYNLSGANTATGNTGTLSMGSSTGTFTIPAFAIDSTGTNTLTITALTAPSGCVRTVSSTNTAAFTVNAFPTDVTVSGSGTFCGSTTITASNGGSGTIYFQGTTSNGTSTTTASNSQVVSATDVYYFRARSAGGCWSNEDSAVVSIDPLPTTVTAGGGGTYCGSTTITASNGGSGTIYFQGTNPTGTSTVIPSTSQVVSSSGTYYFRALSTAGCWGNAGSVTVSINPIPAVITGTLNVCSGSGTTLANSTGTGRWASSNTGVATIGSATGVVAAITTGTTNISYILTSGCYVTATVSVSTTPAAISGSSAVCSGSSTTYTDASPYGLWTSSNAGIATVGSSTGVVTGAANGTAVITYTTGCGTAATKSVTVGNSPVTGAMVVCQGSTTTLSNATSGGAWVSAATSVATVGSSSGLVTGVSGGTATISYTAGACVSTAIVTVNVVPAAITGTATVCAGNTTTLADATLYGTWSSGSTGIATVGSLTGIVSGVSAGTATITYSTGCGSAATKAVTVNSLPSAISGTLRICAGQSTTLTNAGGGTWTSSATSVATIGSASGTVNAVSAGNSNITYVLPTGCITTSVFTVSPLPAAISGAGIVCAGSTTTLSDATSGGAWSSSNTSLATVGSTGVISGIASGNPVISYTLGTGCYVVKVATVNPLPSAIGGTARACVGSTSTLSNSGGGTWSSSNTFLATVGSSTGIVTGVASGSPRITYTLPTGCLTTVVFTVNPLPASISGAASVCVADTTTLSSTAGGNWTSGNTSVATIGSGSGLVTGVTAGSVAITYTLPTGCINTTLMTVNPLPTVGSITGSGTLCEGDTTLLSNATPDGVWSSSDTTIAGVDVDGIVTGESGGTVSVTYTLTDGCGTASATKSLTVNPLPTVDTIAGSLYVCTGQTITLTNAASGGIWSSGSTSKAIVGSSTGIVTGVAAGSSIITYTVTNMCGADEDTMTIFVYSSPAAIGGTASACAGSTTTLTNSTAGGTWSSSNTAAATVGSTGIVTGIAAGTSNISYTLSTGCYAVKVVTINAMPSAISGTARICGTATSTLTNSLSGGVWNSSATSVATVGSTTGVVTGVTVGTTTISYTSTAGCRVTTVVSVVAAPSLASATNSGPMCAGVTLNLTANTPANVVTYAWSGPVPITNSATAAASVPSAGTSASGTYTVTVSNGSGSGCSVNYTTTATVNPLPVAAPTNNGPLCLGASVTLTANPSGGASVYAWSGPNLSSTTAQNPTASPTVTATYSLTVTNGTAYAGCSPTTKYTTTVSVNAVPAASPSNNGPVCNATAVTLTANPSGGANTYAWSGPNLSSTTAQNPTATPTVTSTYSLTVSYGSGYPGCSPSTIYTTTVTVRPTGYWLGGTSTSWATAANWCGGVPVTTTDILIPTGASNYPSLTSGTGSARNVTIQPSSSLTINGGILQVSGAISNSGTFTATNGTIEMNGSSSQTIPSGVFASNTVKNLTINNSAGVTVAGALNIAAILKISSGTLTTGGNITLLSTSTQTALVDGSGAGSISGNITMQRYLDSAYGYRYISSPFAAATLSQLSGYVNFSATFPNFYRYDENVNYAGWVIDTVLSDTLRPFAGYTANFGTSTTPLTISLTGQVNNGSMSTTIYNHNQTYTQGFNLVGNPYPSPIDWTASTGWTKTNIDNAVYYFNHGDTNQYYGRYSSYISGVSSDGIANNIIPAMQGFFVHVSAGSFPVTGTLGCTNSVRTTNLNPHYFKQTATADRPLLRLDAGFSNNNGNTDPTVIYFDANGSGNFDHELDALKLMNTDAGVPSLYSLSADDKLYSIQALKDMSDSETIIPLGLKTDKDGVVRFNLRNVENMSSAMHVWFYDSKTGSIQDMKDKANYEVQLSSGKYERRFFLELTKGPFTNIPGVDGELNAYSSGGNLYVYVGAEKGDVAVTDMLGRTLVRQELVGTGYHEIRLHPGSGIYVVTLYSTSGKQSKKIFVGND